MYLCAVKAGKEGMSRTLGIYTSYQVASSITQLDRAQYRAIMTGASGVGFVTITFDVGWHAFGELHKAEEDEGKSHRCQTEQEYCTRDGGYSEHVQEPKYCRA
jgi:hypothetical protein